MMFHVSFLLLMIYLQQYAETKGSVIRSFRDLSSSVDRIISYYRLNYEEMNFDGVFGLIVLNSTLSNLIKSATYWGQQAFYVHLIEIEKDLLRKSDSIRSILPKAINSVRKQDEAYFQKMGKLYAMDWFPRHQLILSEVEIDDESESSQINYTEELSDECIHELLRTNESAKSRCSPSERCLDLVLQRGAHGYELLHQALYMVVVGELGCVPFLDRELIDREVTVNTIRQVLCSWVFSEFNSLRGLPDLTAAERDLLLEQIFVCGELGALQFISLELLDRIISWQLDSGCFGPGNAPNISELDMMASRSGGVRKLLTEKPLPGGCLSHFTSVAAAAFAIYLRAFLLPEVAEYLLPGHLNLYSMLTLAYKAEQNPNIPALMKDDSGEPLPETNWIPFVDKKKVAVLRQLHGIAPVYFLHDPSSHWTGSAIFPYLVGICGLSLFILIFLRVRWRILNYIRTLFSTLCVQHRRFTVNGM
ncbi:unnamed protein product [Calicophoron daubneyi]|uniref:Uncharacterized protein n=1 Tax=Calicophoron daubneyi TaxID=300641 RepID=A0AAV2T3Y1_CALDB